jgi:hypothetical protein
MRFRQLLLLKWYHLLIVFLAILGLLLFALCHGREKNGPITMLKLDDGNTRLARYDTGIAPVYLMRRHQFALYSWFYEKKRGHLRAPATLIHFDSHSDLLPAPPWPLKADQPFELGAVEKQIAEQVSIANWLIPALESGLITDIYWVIPPMKFYDQTPFSFDFGLTPTPSPDGDDTVELFFALKSLTFRSPPSSQIDALRDTLRAGRPVSRAYEFIGAHPAFALENLAPGPYRLRVVTLAELSALLAKEKMKDRPILFDFDFDYFCTPGILRSCGIPIISAANDMARSERAAPFPYHHHSPAALEAMMADVFRFFDTLAPPSVITLSESPDDIFLTELPILENQFLDNLYARGYKLPPLVATPLPGEVASPAMAIPPALFSLQKEVDWQTVAIYDFPHEIDQPEQADLRLYSLWKTVPARLVVRWYFDPLGVFDRLAHEQRYARGDLDQSGRLELTLPGRNIARQLGIGLACGWNMEIREAVSNRLLFIDEFCLDRQRAVFRESLLSAFRLIGINPEFPLDYLIWNDDYDELTKLFNTNEIPAPLIEQIMMNHPLAYNWATERYQQYMASQPVVNEPVQP